ncbi:MAG: hypothetical protein QOE70_4894 [Chthoniobacter sp.]|jgi:mono/diheme cytochrome c family protein|nr:hypothetical protein [Chthoniobacter sp.]
MRRFLTTTILCLLPWAAGAITPQEAEFFEKSVRPVLAEQCYKCHGPEKQKGDIRVDSREALLRDSGDGPVAVSGKPDESALIKSIRHQGDSKMPAKADKLPDDQIAALVEWVRIGMPWPEQKKAATPGATAEGTKGHWSWQPLREPPVPPIQNPASRIQNPVDAFIAAKLAEKGLAMSPPASRRTLLRRATFDLTGLPPTMEETAAFERDDSPEAFAKAFDRLLASPRYGERWGRYWLDVARYADTKGYLVANEERRFPYSFTYRDWVIQAFNEDLPYDQFIIQQIAGDQVAQPGDNRPLAALGFLTLGRRFLNNPHDIIDDRIDLVSRGLMGLSVGCARCHDHKFDPISAQDYYALYGVFASSVEPPSKDLPLLAADRDPAIDADYRKQLAEREGKIAGYFVEKREQLAWRTLLSFGVPAIIPPEASDRLLDRVGHEQLVQLRNKIEELNAGPLSPPRAMALLDAPTPTNPRVFIHGNPGRPGDPVPRRFLTVLSGGDPKPFTHGSGRLELARAIASKDNPLTPRVMVNRVWNLHFGRGLVRTPGDFGTKGEPPTHPELLDWLASRFVAEGWSIKKLHRTIMLSAAYQQASDDRTEASQSDPDNRLVWRMNRRRLDFEALRDSLLACAGQLDLAVGGRGVELSKPPFARRRAVYGYIDRQNLPGLFRTFDFASPDASSPQRFVTSVPQQALFMMNSPFVIDQARALVAPPRYHEATAYEEQIQELYQRIFARRAEPAEVDAGLRFVMSGITAPAVRSEEQPRWKYGWGHYDPIADLVEFHPLPKFTGKAWQGGPKVPDPALGWVVLTPEGGHPGDDTAHGAIRRWTAPRDGVISIDGKIERPEPLGDGIVASIVSSRGGQLLRTSVAPKQAAEMKLEGVAVKGGDTLDFIVDCAGTAQSDSFRWAMKVHGETGEWDASAQFAGPPAPLPPPLTPWEQYAQVLLEANEFTFVD